MRRRDTDTASQPKVAPAAALGSPSSSVVLRNAAVLLAIVAAGFTIEYFRGIIRPLVIAVFLLLLIDGFSRTLGRQFPSWPARLRSILGAVLTVAGFALVVLVCIQNARAFAGQIQVIEPKLDALLADLSNTLQTPPLTVGDLFRRGGDAATALTGALGVVRAVISGAVLVVIYLGFLLASQQAFGRKMTLLFPSNQT